MTTDIDSALAPRIRSAVAEVTDRYHLPGISVGVVRGDDLICVEASGCADIESKTPADPARRQRIASITKTMTGLCVMALVEEGRLSLETRVQELLPDVYFDGPAETMTVRHLLTHTSGIGEAPTMGALAVTIDPNAPGRTQGDFSTLYRDGIVVEVPPGTKWAYANHGYALLGEIIVRTEGAPLGDVMQRRIFGPLGMKETECSRDPHAGLSTGYHRAPGADTRELLERAGRPVPEETPVDGYNVRGMNVANDHHGMLAAGAVQSTMPDMAKYASALLRRGGGIVRTETFDAMIPPQWCPDDRLTSWGLSFTRWNRAGRRSFGHTGSYFGGWNSGLAVFPDDSIAVLVHTNVMLDRYDPLLKHIHRGVFAAPEPHYEDRPIDTAILSTAPGVYECTPGKLTSFRPSTNVGRIQISRDGDGLVLHSRRGVWKAGARLLPVDRSDPAFFALEHEGEAPSYVLLTRDADGRVDGLRYDDLGHMVRTDQVAPWV